MKPNLAVITASTRESRFGNVVANWFVAQAVASDLFDVDPIDLADMDLDRVQSQHHPKMGRYTPGVRAFADRIGRADAFVFVTPEYNHGYPASLKHAIDSIYAEWTLKPAAVVSYGGVSGGLRAAEQLRTVMGELRVHDIREAVVLPKAPLLFDADGTPKDADMDVAARNLLLELDWWAQALMVARATTPFPL